MYCHTEINGHFPQDFYVKKSTLIRYYLSYASSCLWNIVDLLNKNFWHSHQVYCSLEPPNWELLIFSSCQYKMGAPPKGELLTFSSCLSKITAPLTKNSNLLINSNIAGRDIENFSYFNQFHWSLRPAPTNKNFSSSYHVYRRWKPR